MLRMEEHNNAEDYEEYLRDTYEIELDALNAFFEQMISGNEIDDEQHELLMSLYVVGFEFGKLHERFVKDMEFLS